MENGKSPETGMRAVIARLRGWGLVPEAERPSLAAFKPKGKPQLLSLLALLLVTLVFMVMWCRVQQGMLFDPMLQNDDVRQHVFAFHRYDSGTLINDPMAEEMLRLAPPLIRGLYFLVTPVTGLFIAAKVVQGLALAIILVAALMLATSPRNGPAAAGVLLILALRSDVYLLHIVGGHARSFGFTLCFLWLAGVLTGNQWARLAAACLSALCYMPGLAVILGAEGMYALRNGVPFRAAYFRRRFIRYGAMVAVSLGLLLIYGVTKREAGSLPTYEQARMNPAFGQHGRTVRVPLEPMVMPFVEGLSAAFRLEKSTVIGDALSKRMPSETVWLVILLIVAGAVCAVGRLWPHPVILAIVLAAAVLTTVAQLAAFRLYIPQRYMLLGTGLTSLAVGVHVFALVGSKRETSPHWPAIRNSAAAVFCLVIWLFGGGMTRQSHAVTISGNTEKALFTFVKSLPKDAMFAGHPLDCDDIPFWAGRAAVANMETTLPWMDKMWERRSKACRDMLAAIYTQDKAVFLAFCDQYRVTHLIIFKGRYLQQLKQRSVSFQPMTQFAFEQIGDLKDPRKLVINQITRRSVVFNDEKSRYAVVDVQKLREDWQK